MQTHFEPSSRLLAMDEHIEDEGSLVTVIGITGAVDVDVDIEGEVLVIVIKGAVEVDVGTEGGDVEEEIVLI